MLYLNSIPGTSNPGLNKIYITVNYVFHDAHTTNELLPDLFP